MPVYYLQEDVKIDDKAKKITGILKYVDKFDAFDKGAEGNFLALTFDARPGDQLTFESATDGNPVDLTKDKYLIYKVSEGKTEMKFKLVRGGQTEETTYNIEGLTRMPKDGVGG